MTTAVRTSRGHPATVTMRTTTALAPIITGIALAGDVIDAAERIQTAAAVGSRQLVSHEAGRIGQRATKALGEFRQMAGDVEARR